MGECLDIRIVFGIQVYFLPFLQILRLYIKILEKKSVEFVLIDRNPHIHCPGSSKTGRSGQSVNCRQGRATGSTVRTPSDAGKHPQLLLLKVTQHSNQLFMLQQKIHLPCLAGLGQFQIKFIFLKLLSTKIVRY